MLRRRFVTACLVLFFLAFFLWDSSAIAGEMKGGGFQVPSFVSRVPSGHFAGVSYPSVSLHEARKSAVSDVVRQVLGTIQARYDYRYTDRVYGDARSPSRSVNDRLRRRAFGIVLDVERSIVDSSHVQDGSGRYIYFILVKYPESKIQEMRRLSRGAQVSASVLSERGGVVRVRVTESNDVAVTLSIADITVRKRNRLAGIYNFCIWKVSEGSKDRYTVGFNPVQVRDGSADVKLDIRHAEKSLGDYLLGADVDIDIRLRGVDEVGRKVTVMVAD